MVTTTVIGSFPRTKELVRTLHALAEGIPVDEAALLRLVEENMRVHIGLQQRAGIDIIGTGEAGRINFLNDVIRRVTGFGEPGEQVPSTQWFIKDMLDFPVQSQAFYERHKEAFDHALTHSCMGPIAYRGHQLIESELALFTRLLTEVGRTPASAFVSVVDPTTVAHSMENSNGVYESEEAYLFAIAAALQEEVQLVVKAGFNVQLDAPGLLMNALLVREQGSLTDYRDRFALWQRVLTFLVESVPKERVRIHACWGNHLGPHASDIALGAVLDKLLELPCSLLLLEWNSPAHLGNIEAFKGMQIPKGMRIGLGFISPKNPEIPSIETLSLLTRNALQYIPQEHLVMTTNCGFGTYAGISYIEDLSVIEEMLARLVAVAKSI